MSFRWIVIGLFVLGAALAYQLEDGRAQEKEQEKSESGKGAGEPGAPQEEESGEDEVLYPGDQFKKLAYFVGTWEGELTLPPKGGRGEAKVQSRVEYRSALDKHFVVFDAEQSPPPGLDRKFQAHGLFTYDRELGLFRHWWFTNLGVASEGSGKWLGNTLRFDFRYELANRPIERAIIYEIISPTEYRLKVEQAFAGEKMVTSVEGTLTKLP